MKRTTISTAVLALAGVSVLPMAQAQNYGQGFSLNPGGGYYAFDSELELNDEGFPAIGLEYRMTDSIAVELNYLDGDTKNEFTDLATYDIRQLRADGLYYFRPEHQFQPFLAAGVGMFSYEQIEKDIEEDDAIANVGAGLRYFFTRNFSIRSDLRVLNSIEEGYTDGMFNIGLNILFGGSNENSEGDIDLVQSTPADGSSDQDGDGIADVDDQCPDTVEGLATDEQGCPADMDADGIADYSDDCLDTVEGLMVDERGCAIPVESTVSMDLNVNFEFESAQLPPEFYSDVKELATFLKTYEGSEVTIEGHADAVGTNEYNQGLSERRARAIRDILVKDFEIEKDRLKFVGYGENQPVADNDTAAGRSKNRRAATVVTATREPQDPQK